MRRLLTIWPLFIHVLLLGGNVLAQYEPGLGDTAAAPIVSPAIPSILLNDPPRVIDGTLIRLAHELLSPFSLDEDPDGSINTDRPTFTPANTVVPRGRLQIESGYTYTHDLSTTQRTNTHGFPELAVRIGLTDRVEFRTFWAGQYYSKITTRGGGPTVNVNGPSDMEIGLKTQLLKPDSTKPWRPTTALITSLMVPTGGTSYYSSQAVEPTISLLYGWSLTKKLSLAGSTGYLGVRQQRLTGPAGSLERFSQSLVAFYSLSDRTTLFYEWYVLMFTNAADNRPNHNMDLGALYHPTPNTQLDIRAGIGVGDRPSDFFNGAGFSIRF